MKLPELRIPIGKKRDLAGAVVLITGAGDGIGREAAQQMHDAGARVVVLDRRAEAAQAVVKAMGPSAHAITADVTDRQAMQDAIDEVMQRFGQIDVVIANAGIAPQSATLRCSAPADFDRVMDVNVTGVFNTVKPAIEPLIASQGHIVIVASAAAFCPPFGGVSYMVSKAAVEQLGRGLRLELSGHGVGTTIAYFGIVETQMTRQTLDENGLGKELNRQLPAPLRQRITAAEAARTIVDGVRRGAPRVVAPRAWTLYSGLRGVLNPLVDEGLSRSPFLKNMTRALEAPSAPGTNQGIKQ